MQYRILFICVLFSVAAAAQTKPTTSKPATTTKPKTTTKPPVLNKPVLKLKNALDSFSYAMGMSMGNFCEKQGILKVNNAVVLQGLNDASKAGDAIFTEQQMNQIISGYLNRQNTEKAKVARVAGDKFMAENAKKPGVVTLASGLQYTVLRAGTDTAKPKLTDTVICHYTGMQTDGTEFESSLTSGQPAEFRLDEVIRGWTEALQMMTVGSKWRLFIPADLGYGDRQGTPFPPGSTLVFDVELLAIKR